MSAPDDTDSSEMIEFSGSRSAITCPIESAVRGPTGAPIATCGGSKAGLQTAGENGESVRTVLIPAGQKMQGAVRRRHNAAVAGIAEEGNGRIGLHQHQVLQPGEHLFRRFREIGEPLQPPAIAAPLQALSVAVGDHPGLRAGAQPARRIETVPEQRPAAQEEAHRFAGTEQAGNLLIRSSGTGAGWRMAAAPPGSPA